MHMDIPVPRVEKSFLSTTSLRLLCSGSVFLDWEGNMAAVRFGAAVGAAVGYAMVVILGWHFGYVGPLVFATVEAVDIFGKLGLGANEPDQRQK